MEFTQERASEVVQKLRRIFTQVKCNANRFVNLQEFYPIIEKYLDVNFKPGLLPKEIERKILVCFSKNRNFEYVEGIFTALAPGIVVFNAENPDMRIHLDGTVYRLGASKYGHRFYVDPFIKSNCPTNFTLKTVFENEKKYYREGIKGQYFFNVGAGHASWGDDGEITNECWDSLIPWLEKWLPIEISGPTEYE